MSLPAKSLPRVAPECVGVSSSAILAFMDTLDAAGGTHSFMLLRHGRVAAEGWWAPYRREYPHALFSLSKSFTSTAVGLAVSEGLLSVDDSVVSFFPERVPEEVPPNLADMRVRHLLTMTTGHDEDATGHTTDAEDGDWVRAFLSLPVEHTPGSKFVYNSAATYMCSAIVQRLTGETVLAYLTPRLFEPLGIANPTWETCPKGINVGGWGLSLRTEDIARFGQCYLQEGCWEGRQLIPAAWVREATARQASNGDDAASDWTQGYGYQFWRCRHNAYRGDGAFGQYCIVTPEQDAVLAITSGVGDMQAVLNAAWDHLLPGMGAASEASGDPALTRRLAGLAIPPPVGSATSAMAERLSARTYRLDPNPEGLEEIAFTFSSETLMTTRRANGCKTKIRSGSDGWVEGELPGPALLPRAGGPPVGRIAARGAWAEEDTYTMKVCYVETPFIETIECSFEGDGVTVTRTMNVGFGPTDRPPLIGHAV